MTFDVVAEYNRLWDSHAMTAESPTHSALRDLERIIRADAISVVPEGGEKFIRPEKPYVLSVVPPVRFDHISYEGEIWYDATGREIDPDEVRHALNSLAEQFPD